MLGIETIKITPEILIQACEIDEFKGIWSALETYTTGLQVLSEVAEFGKNFQRTLIPLKEQDLTVKIICELHKFQIKNNTAGAYKITSNQLSIMKEDGTFGLLDTATPEDVAPLMNKLIIWLNDSLKHKSMHPLITIAVFTSVFLQISPFTDGNMRIACFLSMLLLFKNGYVYAPYVPLDRIVNKHGDFVFKTLKHNQESLETGQPDWSKWLDCFLTLLQEQAGTLRTRLNTKNQEMSNLPTLSAKILTLFEQHERLQMKQIIKLTNGQRSTIKLRLQELINDEYLRRHGQARSTWYSLV
ncbi:MAG: Fic family protein [Alphaproteobacteria bacterium]|nr:Fic family protein [Alphaproteobacteria bacterium]